MVQAWMRVDGVEAGNNTNEKAKRPIKETGTTTILCEAL